MFQLKFLRSAPTLGLSLLLALLLYACGQGGEQTNKPTNNQRLDSLRQSLQQHPDSVDLRIQLAEEYFSYGDTLAGLQTLDTAVKHHPYNYRVHFLRGSWHYIQQEDRKARSLLERAIELGGDEAELYYQLGNVLVMQDSQRAALLRYQQALERDSISPAYAFGKGVVHYQLGEEEDAYRWLREAVRRDSQFVKAYDLLFTLTLHDQQDTAAARQWADRLLEVAPNHPLAYFHQGEYWQRRAQDAEQPRMTEEAVKRRVGHLKGARNAYTRALQLSPQFPAALYNRGMVNEWLGKNQEAVNDYQAARQLNPADARPSFRLGALYEYHKEYERALENYRLAVQTDSSLQEAQNAIEELEKEMEIERPQ